MVKKNLTGVIFGIIRNGRGLMPPYNRIEDRAELLVGRRPGGRVRGDAGGRR